MSLFVKVGGVVALIGAGSYFSYGYVTSGEAKMPGFVKNALSGFSDNSTKKELKPSDNESGKYATTPLNAGEMTGREKLWAEEMAFRQKEEQKQAAHRAKCRSQQRRQVTTKPSCRPRRG